MFIYTMRASTIRFFGVICVALAILITIIAFVPTDGVIADGSVETDLTVRYEKIKTNEDRVKFLNDLGWQVESECVECVNVTIPDEFDKIYSAYNEIQKAQGLDLTGYRKKEVTRYTYKVTNYEGYAGTVYANILIYRNNVIGGDICSADVNGFVRGFEK